MSEMEYNEGKLIFVSDDIEQVAYELVQEQQIKIPDFYDDAAEWFSDNCRDVDYMILNKKVYKAEFKYKRAEEPPEAVVVTEDDGTISFATYHYNGGGSLEDVIEDALREQENSNGNV